MVQRRDLPGTIEVAGVVRLLVAVCLRQRGAQLEAPRVHEQARLGRIAQPGVEARREVFRASLQDSDEREALVAIRLEDDVVENLGDPIDGLGDEGDVRHAQRHRERVERLEAGAARRRVALEAPRRRRRSLLLRQAVDLVVVQQHGQVHVVTDRVNPVRGTDAAAVAVAGDHPHVEVGPGHGEPGRDRRRPAVDRVHPVGVHVVREAARAADAGDEHGLLGRQLLVAAQPLHGRQDAVVTASGAPARCRVALVVVERVVLVDQLQETFGQRGGHGWDLTLLTRSQPRADGLDDRVGLERLTARLAPAVDVDESTSRAAATRARRSAGSARR